MPEPEAPSIGLCAQVACTLDVAVFKPGNVSFQSPAADMTAVDFLLSAAAIAPVLERAPLRRVGDTILDCIRATRRVTPVNTNLGIVLLLAPLASVQPHLDLRGGVMRALMRLDVEDARTAFEAIRLAKPGGLGRVEQQDVAGEPTVTLREAMALAADRDLVARQYVNDFDQVFAGAEMLREETDGGRKWVQGAVLRVFLRLLADYPDSLIQRKSGRDAAEEVSRHAHRLVHTEARGDPHAVGQFDAWLRLDRAQPRNPGTTADLLTASLFVALRRGIIPLPLPRATIPPPAE